MYILKSEFLAFQISLVFFSLFEYYERYLTKTKRLTSSFTLHHLIGTILIGVTFLFPFDVRSLLSILKRCMCNSSNSMVCSDGFVFLFPIGFFFLFFFFSSSPSKLLFVCASAREWEIFAADQIATQRNETNFKPLVLVVCLWAKFLERQMCLTTFYSFSQYFSKIL